MKCVKTLKRKKYKMSSYNFKNEEAPKTMQFSNNQKIVKLVLDIGEQLIMCGGEVSRVEETVIRVCTAYGAIKTDVFCITSTMIVTSIWANGDPDPGAPVQRGNELHPAP